METASENPHIKETAAELSSFVPALLLARLARQRALMHLTLGFILPGAHLAHEFLFSVVDGGQFPAVLEAPEPAAL